MTQTLPPPAPAQGIAAPPVILTAGVLATIPLPVLPRGGPVPWRTPWVVMLNSSPYTLLVSSGGTVTQIAAFTSDKVYVQAVGQAPTVLPQAGAGTVSPGTDSTVNATWYAVEPPGTYPAALGSGQVPIAQVTSTVVDVGRAVANGGFTSYGPFSTAGFAGLRVNMNNNSAAAVLRFVIFYTDANGNNLGQHSFIVGVPGGAAGIAAVTWPHLGDLFSFNVFNNGGGPGNYDLFVAQTTVPIAQWAVPFAPLLRGSAVVGAGATVTLDDSGGNSSTFTYGGPTTFSFISGATAFIVDLQYQSLTGAWVPNLMTVGNTDIPGTRFSGNLLAPATPLRIRATNNDAAAHTITATVVTDDWRVGG